LRRRRACAGTVIDSVALSIEKGPAFIEIPRLHILMATMLVGVDKDDGFTLIECFDT